MQYPVTDINLYLTIHRYKCAGQVKVYPQQKLEEVWSVSDMFRRLIESQQTIPMRVMLISDEGSVRSMRLPETMEGRYHFSEDETRNSFPLYIEAVEDRWVAFAGEDAEFVLGERHFAKKVFLEDRNDVYLQFDGHQYVLYVEAEHPDDYEFIPYYLEEKASYMIGRQPECHIHYPNECVSREHASLRWHDGAWYIVDENSSNGTYVNGKKVDTVQLRNGDAVFIMGLYILMGAGFIAINNKNGRVNINTPKIRRVWGQNDVAYPACPIVSPHRDLYERQPRKRYKAGKELISIEMPPMQMSANKIPLMLRMGSPLVMGSQAVMSGNIAMTLTSLVFPFLTQGLTEKDRKEYEAKRSVAYRAYLEEKEKEIYLEKKNEERLLNKNYPSLDTALDFSLTRKRLWERRKSDEDFLSLRIGTGQLPLIAKMEYNPKRFELERDPLAEEMYALAERPVILEDAPVMLSLKEDYVVGIPGPSWRAVGLIRNTIMQLVLTHSYDEVKLVLMVEPEQAATFDFVRYLPHNWDDDQSIRFFVTSRSDASQISEFLSRETKPALEGSNKQTWLRRNPSYVIIALSKDLFDCVEILKDIMFQEEYSGVSIIAAFDGVPKECSKIIDLNDAAKLIDLKEMELSDQAFDLDSCDSPAQVQESMKELMRVKLMLGSQAYSLPNMLTFMEMYSAGKVEFLNPLKRWADNNPVKSLAAPVGIGTDGRLFTLDLHEKYQGPHGLVAGMTGSGKSEFLITYILSMAVNYSPDEVAFILIDYKGGGLADAFEDKDRGIHLPHLAGTITNLDGDSIQRSLMSIKSELMRRQTVFKEVKSQTNEGTLDIYDYQKLYRNKKVAEPMPHLFIISDEFAELKQQQPDFMDELISAARIGRSLGVHLILATQKPSGVVNDQIWSNTKFRACLRVQDRSDSMEMLKRPEAAELKHTGRFYLQVGYNEYFALGQSAWCGAEYIPQNEPPEEKDDSVQFIDNVGQALLNVRPEKEARVSECRQIVAIVQYLSDLAKREGIRSRALWVEPLTKQLELASLIERCKNDSVSGISALIGMVDDPEKQRQFPLYLDFLGFHNMLLVGSAGSGKSTFLRTMLFSLITRYPPSKLNYYLVDLSNGILGGYKDTSHCGAYLTEKDGMDIGRLLQFIRGIIEKRKKLFAEAEVSGYEAYCEIHPIPLVLVIVDGFTNIGTVSNGDEYALSIHDYLREGTNFGVRFVLTCNHTNEVSSMAKQELDYRIAMQAKDHYEYGDILDIYCKVSPPEVTGRGMCLVEGRPLAYQTAMLDCTEGEQKQVSMLRERLSELSRRYEGFAQAEQLPMVDAEQTYEDFCAFFQNERIPLGYSRRDMRPVAIPFQQLHSMSLYFGNPKSVQPVFRNLLSAASMNRMETIIVRRSSDSVFDGTVKNGPLTGFMGRYSLLESTEEGVTQLSDRILSEIHTRNVLRDEYSVQQGIPLSAKGRSKKAKKYIRAHSVPILVILESFCDFVSASGENEELWGKYTVFFNQMWGYNIYFAAGFYPGDDNAVGGHQIGKNYNKGELLLLFGGRYDKVPMPSLPFEVSKMNLVDPEYNRFLLKYQEVYYPMVMPCGVLEDDGEDPDDAAII